jgi:hypothetical protein
VFTRVSQYTEWITACIADPDALHCRGGDGYEPDNGPATAQQLDGPIGNQMHTFHEMGDQDWIKLDVEAGKEYMFMTSRITETVPFLKTVLWLFDGDGRTPITYTETIESPSWWLPWESGTFQESASLVWKADRSGPVYVSVELLPDAYSQVYGPSTRYWLTVGEYERTFLPLLAGPLAPPAPDNDDFSQPVEMAPLPFNHTMNTTDATIAADDPVLCIGTKGGATVWYRLVAPSSGELSVNTLGSNYDTVLAVFSGERGALIPLACNDDYAGLQSQVWLNVTAGETYYVEVASFFWGSAATIKPLMATGGEGTLAQDSVQAGGWLNLSADIVAYPVPVVTAIPAPVAP